MEHVHTFPGLKQIREHEIDRFYRTVKGISGPYHVCRDGENIVQECRIEASPHSQHPFSSPYDNSYKKIIFTLNLETGKVEVSFAVKINNQAAIGCVRGGAHVGMLVLPFTNFYNEETLAELKEKMKVYGKTDGHENLIHMLNFTKETIA